MSSPDRERSVAYRPDIDGLRALAVGLVLVFHGFPGFVPGGFIGVDVFFVISGYLITSILIRSAAKGGPVRTYLADFYRHRIRRIFPALIVVLVACAIYGWFRLFPADYENLTKYIAAGAAFVSNLVLSTESGYFDAGAELKPLTHLWSLAIEEQFYIVWPLVVLAVSRFRRGVLLMPVLAVLTIASFVAGLWLTWTDPTTAYYSPLSRGWELGVGGILAVLHARGRFAAPRRANGVISFIALIAIPLSAVTFISGSQFPGWQALVPVVATAAIIWFGSETWVDRRILALRPVVWVGAISYPLYLWHWVVLAFLRIEHPAPPAVFIVAALVGSVVLAAVTYYFVELPVRRPPLTRVALIALLAMVGVAAYGSVATITRFSGVALTPLQAALSETYDPEPAYRFGECFLDSATQSPTEFAADCSEPATPDGGRILLWGDSLSAQLYAGLDSTRSDHGAGIVQRTASSCPASATDAYPERGYCDQINAFVRAEIVDDPPETVIVDGRWPEDDDQRESTLTELAGFLRDSGVQRVILVGPTPDWWPDLRGILIREQFPGGELPERMQPPGTLAQTLQRDDSLRELSAELGIDYVSMTDLLCTGDECLIRVSDDIPAGLITSDHDHLTAQASVEVFRRLARIGLWDASR